MQLLPTRKIVVSSAKRTVPSGGKTLGRSLKKPRQEWGQELQPCETPEVVYRTGERCGVGHMSDLGVTKHSCTKCIAH